ncbi:MAG: ATP-binding protein [Phycisphaerae bacterium]|nr:ATP-binding protein [Phycisphaerae bacterium]
MKEFFEKAALQNHPLRVLLNFLDREEANEKAKKYADLRFVGYVLEIGYDILTIITSDPFKIAVGGIPRNSLLIMAPAKFDSLPPHFTLLRVLESAPTPLSKEVQQTYFELQKKSMPELDVFTQSELQWGALKTAVLGMFYPHPDKTDAVEFSGDLNNFVSAHKYRVYAPCDDLLNLIVNTLVRPEGRFKIGNLRLTECRLPLPGRPGPKVDVNVSTVDFTGCRTAMFGKTRLGKSNVVKLIAQSLIETQPNVGQLIFDINGEYANDNPQDGNRSLAGTYRDRCEVYALTAKRATPSKPLKLNFYECPESSLRILGSLLRQHGRQSAYIESFSSVELPSLHEVAALAPGSDKIRAIRKLHIYWAILKRAGFDVDETKLRGLAPSSGRTSGFNPAFNAQLRTDAYRYDSNPVPANTSTLDALVAELGVLNRFRRDNPGSSSLTTGSNNPVFQPDDIALLEFLEPPAGRAGTSLLQPFRIYHDRNAGDFVAEILRYIDAGKTVILDLGNANPEVMQYFSDELSKAVFNHQVDKFSNNRLGDHFVQLYFEEAHNLFPRTEDVTTIYSRFAKEGAKYHIGMVYSTQSPTTINRDLLAQTENFFIAHLSSRDEVSALGKLNVAYDSMQDDILSAKTPGYIRMLTRSHRFVVSVQANLFQPDVTEQVPAPEPMSVSEGGL